MMLFMKIDVGAKPTRSRWPNQSESQAFSFLFLSSLHSHQYPTAEVDSAIGLKKGHLLFLESGGHVNPSFFALCLGRHQQTSQSVSRLYEVHARSTSYSERTVK
jgi:hypothetical protein